MKTGGSGRRKLGCHECEREGAVSAWALWDAGLGLGRRERARRWCTWTAMCGGPGRKAASVHEPLRPPFLDLEQVT